MVGVSFQPLLGGALSPFALSYGSFGSVNPGSGTSFTVSSLATGLAPVAPNRRYVYAAIGLASSGTFTVSSVTIAGASASLFAGLNTSSFVQAQIWVAEVPTGTTANVQVTTSANTLCCGVATYPAINPATPTVPDATTPSTATSSPLSLDLNIIGGGAAVGVVQVRDTTATSGGAWSGLIENVDTDIRSTEYFTSAFGGSTGSPFTVTLTRPGTATDSRAVSASLH